MQNQGNDWKITHRFLAGNTLQCEGRFGCSNAPMIEVETIYERERKEEKQKVTNRRKLCARCFVVFAGRRIHRDGQLEDDERLRTAAEMFLEQHATELGNGLAES